jgi:hypothetical protein
MEFKEIDIENIKICIDKLSEIEWTSENDDKLNQLFFEISDIFEDKLQHEKSIKDWRMVEICFQHRALTDNEIEYPKTKSHCILMIKDFLKQVN